MSSLDNSPSARHQALESRDPRAHCWREGDVLQPLRTRRSGPSKIQTELPHAQQFHPPWAYALEAECKDSKRHVCTHVHSGIIPTAQTRPCSQGHYSDSSDAGATQVPAGR